MIKQLLLVFIGGGLGSALRFYFSIIVNQEQIKWLPTLLVNLLGCLLLGVVFYLAEKGGLSKNNYVLIGTGFCGGLTTFSTFSLEVFQLIKAQDYLGTFGYLSISIIAGILCAFLGYWMIKSFC